MSTNITDLVVDNVVEAIQDNIETYFGEMEELGFTMPTPKVIKKGLPSPIKMVWPSIFVRPARTEQVDRYVYMVRVEIAYFAKNQDAEVLARRIARGADALGQLIRDRFSEQSLSYEFEYAAPEGHPEAVASLTVEIIA
jgi:hypothetical protein